VDVKQKQFFFSLHVGITEIRVEMSEHFETFYCIRKQDCNEYRGS